MPAKHVGLAIVAGLLLGTMPMWRYAHFGGSVESHMDHEPRHGGQLGMVGDAHVEMVRRLGKVQVYVSDAWRQPLAAADAWAVFDRSTKSPLQWDGHRFVGDDEPAAREIEAVVMLADGRRLAISFDYEEP
jgi:hypothetical protein